MLVGLIYLYLKGGSFQLADLAALPLTATEQTWLFFAFLVGVRGQGADVPGAHLVAGRARRGADRRLGDPGRDHAEDRRLRLPALLLPIVPDAGQECAWLVIALSLIAVVYIGLVALVQEDMKKLIAYSSISHMGFVTLGTFIAFALVRDCGQHRCRAPGPAGRDGADDLARLHFRRDVLAASACSTTACTAA